MKNKLLEKIFWVIGLTSIFFSSIVFYFILTQGYFKGIEPNLYILWSEFLICIIGFIIGIILLVKFSKPIHL